MLKASRFKFLALRNNSTKLPQKFIISFHSANRLSHLAHLYVQKQRTNL